MIILSMTIMSLSKIHICPKADTS